MLSVLRLSFAELRWQAYWTKLAALLYPHVRHKLAYRVSGQRPSPDTKQSQSSRPDSNLPTSPRRRRWGRVCGPKGYGGFWKQPYIAEIHQDRPPVLVDIEVGVVQVGLGEHYAFTTNIDRKHLLLGLMREQAVRLAQSTC